MRVLFNDPDEYITELKADAEGERGECGIVRIAYERRPGPHGIGAADSLVSTYVSRDEPGERTLCEFSSFVGVLCPHPSESNDKVRRKGDELYNCIEADATALGLQIRSGRFMDDTATDEIAGKRKAG